jgi:phage recombination protein Bet
MKTEDTEKQMIEFVPFGTKDKIQLTIEIVKRLIAVRTKSGKSCSDEDAFRFMLLCQARKLNPFEGDAFLIGFDGQAGPSFSLITAHQAFLKRAEVHPEFDGMESGTIVLRKNEVVELLGDWHLPNDQILGGWATVFFKNRTHAMKKRVRLARFNKNYGVWRDDPAGMICKVAEADALRSSFPTMLGGMFIREEMLPEPTEIAKPVFPDMPTQSNDKPVEATVVEPEPRKAEPPKAGGDFKLAQEPVVEPKKKESSGGSVTSLRSISKQRAMTKAHSTEKKLEPPKEQTPHERLTQMLAIGNYTPQGFMQLAHAEGWFSEGEIGTFDKIPADRVVEFLREENWTFIQELLEQRAGETLSAEAAERGSLL